MTLRTRGHGPVPAFDQSGYLPRALGSILDQDETDWEGVVLDDESTDGAREVLATWPADVRLRRLG